MRSIRRSIRGADSSVKWLITAASAAVETRLPEKAPDQGVAATATRLGQRDRIVNLSEGADVTLLDE